MTSKEIAKAYLVFIVVLMVAIDIVTAVVGISPMPTIFGFIQMTATLLTCVSIVGGAIVAFITVVVPE